MTEQETAEVLTFVVMSYPAADYLRDARTVRGMVEVWKTMFEEDKKDEVALAVKQHAAVKKWPPSIAEVRERLALMRHPELLPPDEAWRRVCYLLETESEYGDGPLLDMPPLAAEVVSSIGWTKLYRLYAGRGHAAEGADRAAFMELYKPAFDRAREQAMLPAAMKTSRASARRWQADEEGETSDER